MAKHDWILDEDGEVDIWRLEFDYHNGPECRRCGLVACQNCEPQIYEEECPSEQIELW